MYSSTRIGALAARPARLDCRWTTTAIATKPGYDALVPWRQVHNADNFAQFSFDAVGKPFNLKNLIS